MKQRIDLVCITFYTHQTENFINQYNNLNFEVKQMPFKITVDKEACIGCAACTANGRFDMNDENKAVPKETSVDDAAGYKEDADICPVNAIKVE